MAFLHKFTHASIVLAIAALQQSMADNFLARPSLQDLAEQVDPVLLHRLVNEVEEALGRSLRNSSAQDFEEIQAHLRPTFKSLRKNSNGNLDHSAVSYILHRYFVQQHGWIIRGFQSDSAGDAWNMESAAQLLSGRVPGLVQEIFEKRVGEAGSNLHDVAVLAALLEHLIHEDLHTKLQAVYHMKNLSTNAVLNADRATAVIQLHMMLFIQGYTDLSVFDADQLDLFTEHFSKLYPAWDETRELLAKAEHEVAAGATSFEFKEVAAVLEEAGHRYYKEVHHKQCQHTKSLLLEMEENGTGRVRLVDFYKAALYENKYQFTETIDYLRQIGALDESDAGVPRVIIPNYVSGQSNCVARTSYYAICCPDDCESHFDHLEQVLGQPEAPPAEILASLQGDARLSSLLLRRLDSIAAHHNGLVPLHGRLFAQWMHFAHPHSCIYPHVSGSVYTKTMEEWEEDTGLRSGSTIDELLNWTKQLDEQGAYTEANRKSDVQTCDMWSMEEELVVKQASPKVRSTPDVWDVDLRPGRWVARVVKFVVLLSAVGFILFTLRSDGTGLKSVLHVNEAKQFV